MQFYDKVNITVTSGKGGDGCVSGRKEAGVPYGGPSGGNGGKGGSIIIQADENITTLIQYKYKKNFKAKSGEAGRSKEQYGANAEDLILKVPVGTMIIDQKSDQILYYFEKNKEKYIVVKGGDGGLGNMEFKTSTLQYPDFAILGEPGHIKEITLELQLMGDVALIGHPSVGKSTLINAISNTKAKVADYPFTTLIPHLGSIKLNDFSYNIVDIPGLITGASEGKGLGNQFLRHISKAKIFCIMGDLFAFDKGIDEMLGVLIEVLKYMGIKENRNRFIEEGNDLSLSIRQRNDRIILVLQSGEEIILEKILVFVFNKYDLVEDDEIIKEIENVFMKKIKKIKIGNINFNEISESIFQKNMFIISSAIHFGIDKLIKFFADQLEHFPIKVIDETIKKHHNVQYDEDRVLIKNITKTEKDYLIENNYLDSEEFQYINVWLVDDPEISRLVFVTQRGNMQAEMYFWKHLEHEGLLTLLQEGGFMKGDIMKVKSYYEGRDDRYIQR